MRNIARGNITHFYTDAIAGEYRKAPTDDRVRALFTRYNITAEEYLGVVEALLGQSEHVVPSGIAPDCDDEGDRIYLHCAEAAGLDCVITFDTILLALGELGDCQMMRPGEYLTALRGRGDELAD